MYLLTYLLLRMCLGQKSDMHGRERFEYIPCSYDSYDIFSLPAQTLSVNVSALLRTECRGLVYVARSDPALLSLAV